MLRTWFETMDDGRAAAVASIGEFHHWVVQGTELRARQGLRHLLRIKGREDLIPQLGLAD